LIKVEQLSFSLMGTITSQIKKLPEFSACNLSKSKVQHL